MKLIELKMLYHKHVLTKNKLITFFNISKIIYQGTRRKKK